MAVSVFVKFDGIDGEATESKHQKWMPVQSFSWGVTHPVDVVGSGLASGRAHIHDFSFVKSTDSSSPKLALNCCTGEHVKLVTVEFSQSTGGNEPLVYMQYKFTDVMIAGFQISGHDATDRPTESISVAFSKWEQVYQPTDGKGGLGGKVPAGFDVKANKKV